MTNRKTWKMRDDGRDWDPLSRMERFGSTAHGIARVILLLVAGVIPWLMGGTDPISRMLAFFGVLAAEGFWLVGLLLIHRTKFVVPWTILPLIGGIALGCFQLIPLEPGALQVLSPAAAKLRAELLPALGETEFPLMKHLFSVPVDARQPISLYPLSTQSEIAWLICGTCTFLMSAHLFSTPRAMAWMCRVMAVNGACLAFFGLVQRLTANGKIYWYFPLPQYGVPFGPFVNRNNAGAYLNLCLACAIPLALRALPQIGFVTSNNNRLARWNPVRIFSRLKLQIQEFLGRMDARLLTVISIVCCIAGGILCTLSRGAFLALVGTVVVTFLGSRSIPAARSFAWLGLASGLMVILLLGWMGMTDSVRSRLTTILDQGHRPDSRFEIWSDTLKVIPDFLSTGSGLGTYRFVYGPYQQRLVQEWFFHAENEYLEALVDGGIPALALLLSMIGGMLLICTRMLRSGEGEVPVFALGGICAVTGQVISSCFDFAVYVMPAQLVFFAMVCGAISGQFARLRLGQQPSPVRDPGGFPVVGFLTACVSAAALAWGFNFTWQVQATNLFADVSRGSAANEAFAQDKLEHDLSNLAECVAQLPYHAEAQFQLAELYFARYQLDTVAKLSESTQLKQDLGCAESEDPVSFSYPDTLHRAVVKAVREFRDEDVKRLREVPQVVENLIPAIQHLALARRGCPLMPYVHLRLAEICFSVAPLEAEQAHLSRGVRLAPGNAKLLYDAGEVDFESGRFDEAFAYWRDCWRLNSKYVAGIVRTAGKSFELSEIIAKVTPQNPEAMIQLAQQHYDGPKQVAERKLIAKGARKLVDELGTAGFDREYALGRIEALAGNLTGSEASFQQAVELDPGNWQCRYEWARVLHQLGDLGKAAQQADLCAQMDPARPEFRSLLEHIKRTAAGK